MMKYIVTVNEEDLEEIFVFPRTVDHDCMAEVLSRIKDQSWGNWKRVFRKPVSAGFVDDYWQCVGRSETLDLDSRSIDTLLLRSDKGARQVHREIWNSLEI